MTKEIFLKLVERVKDGSASDQDILLYHAWFGKFQSVSEWNDAEMGNAEELKSLIGQRIDAQINSQYSSQVIRPLWIRIVAAASVLLFISLGGYYFIRGQQSAQIAYYKSDVGPGQSQATLTLANGQKIVLTRGLTRKLAQGTTAIQINNGIVYTSGLTAKATKEITYNTLSTAIGEQSPFPLILPDGSKVWLNALSSITFPTAFNGKERVVKITGEAMFEVAHNVEHPFKVQTDKQTIEDIGTVFNVNAYADEPANQTTLIEGIVKVNNKLLKPGEQSDGSHIKTVNTKRYSAWRTGDFYFEDDNIKTVMRQLSRWYNVEINYDGDVTTERFNAQISRSKNISVILHILENTKGVHFKVEGRRITVIE
jgi:ferric-dicitrate binding protein FerR (iron transport regulator)